MTCLIDAPTTDVVYQGDVNVTSIVVLGGSADLTTGPTFVGSVAKGKGYLRESADLVVTLIDPVERLVEVDYGDATGWLHDAAIGLWMLTIKATWPDLSSLTYPKPGYLMIDVRRSAS